MFPSGTHSLQIRFDDRERQAIVYVAPTATAESPIVFALHGAGTCAKEMVDFCGFNETADAEGLVVVYPNGTGRSDEAGTWNGGPQCGYAGRHNVDDVGFIRRLIGQVREQGHSGHSLFAMGMSNGGLMCYRLAEELAEEFAAVACVAGAMGKPACAPARPVSILHLHGTDDEFVPYEGGIGKRSLTKTPFISVPESLNAWVCANGCDLQANVTLVKKLVEDRTQVELHAYDHGLNNSRVHHYRIQGGGHTWPGRPTKFAFLGATTGNLDANEAIWNFFASTISIANDGK